MPQILLFSLLTIVVFGGVGVCFEAIRSGAVPQSLPRMERKGHAHSGKATSY